MIIFKDNEEIRILNKINFNGVMDLKNLKFQGLNLDRDNDIKKIIKDLKKIYENFWKSKNEINTSVKLSLTISIENNDSFKITQLEETLKKIDLIYDFFIYKFDSKNNIYKIVFNGSPDNFLKIMNDNNYKFDTQNLIWKIK